MPDNSQWWSDWKSLMMRIDRALDRRHFRIIAARRTAEARRKLAQQLHTSNAWHCGCPEHNQRQPRSPNVGLVVGQTRRFGVLIETVQLTKHERTSL